MNLFNVLKVREKNDKVDFKTTRQDLPPIFQRFAQTFHLMKGALKKIEFKSPDNGELIIFGYFVYYLEQKKDEYEIYDFFSLDEIFEVNDRLYKENDLTISRGLLPIGSCSSDTIIMVGNNDENQDQIFLERNRKENLIKVADNIFEFIQLCKFQEMEEIFIAPVNYNQLYKNWGEDFWRVRETA